jgi:hypothetical protein
VLRRSPAWFYIHTSLNFSVGGRIYGIRLLRVFPLFIAATVPSCHFMHALFSSSVIGFNGTEVYVRSTVLANKQGLLVWTYTARHPST